MQRSLSMHRIFYILLIAIVTVPIDGAVQKKPYTTGIADIVRKAFQRNLNRFILRQTSYDSDVFRYTQASQRGTGGLLAGEACRLTSTICSFDEQCCSGRCLCRRWTITGEERCVRKCF